MIDADAGEIYAAWRGAEARITQLMLTECAQNHRTQAAEARIEAALEIYITGGDNLAMAAALMGVTP